MVNKSHPIGVTFDMTKSVKNVFKNVQAKYVNDEIKLKLAASITRREYLPCLWAVDKAIEKNLMLSLELVIDSMLKSFMLKNGHEDLFKLQRDQTLSINVDFHVL